jgi:hypothetical protein
VIPGLVALVTVKGLGAEKGDLVHNNAIPLLMRDLLPNGVLGIAVTSTSGCPRPSGGNGSRPPRGSSMYAG